MSTYCEFFDVVLCEYPKIIWFISSHKIRWFPLIMYIFGLKSNYLILTPKFRNSITELTLAGLRWLRRQKSFHVVLENEKQINRIKTLKKSCETIGAWKIKAMYFIKAKALNNYELNIPKGSPPSLRSSSLHSRRASISIPSFIKVSA